MSRVIKGMTYTHVLADLDYKHEGGLDMRVVCRKCNWAGFLNPVPPDLDLMAKCAESVLVGGGMHTDCPARRPKPAEPTSYKVPVSDEHKQLMNDIGKLLAEAMPPGWGFGLLVFTFGEGGTMTWVSNASRPDMLKAMAEFIQQEGN